MRQIQARQLPLREPWGNHPRSEELRAISALLDALPGVARLAHADLVGARSARVGRSGVSGEQVVRLAILKQVEGVSYAELAFMLVDSRAAHTFSRLSLDDTLSSSALQENIKLLTPQTWEAINGFVVGLAHERNVENGERVRTDCTVVDANVLEPNDARLLWDCVRVLTRVVGRVMKAFPAATWDFADRTLAVKSSAYQIQFLSRGDVRIERYKKLIDIAASVYLDGTHALKTLGQLVLDDDARAERERPARELTALLVAMGRVLSQTKRRIIDGESVPAAEKIVSIFEQHTDIVIKDGRDVRFGHKVCLTGGASSMIIDCMVLEGNPSDLTLVQPTLARVTKTFGRPPREASYDGGFTSADNLAAAKAAGVVEVCFHKQRGLTVAEMVSDDATFRRLRNFRAGIEGCISTLKRAFSMGRCTWRGLASFKSYVHASVVAFNLSVLARRLAIAAAAAAAR